MLLPGDCLRVPAPAPADELVTRLLQIHKVVRPEKATVPVRIKGTFDPASSPALTSVASPEAVAQVGTIMRPVLCPPVLALPTERTPGNPAE